MARDLAAVLTIIKDKITKPDMPDIAALNNLLRCADQPAPAGVGSRGGWWRRRPCSATGCSDRRFRSRLSRSDGGKVILYHHRSRTELNWDRTLYCCLYHNKIRLHYRALHVGVFSDLGTLCQYMVGMGCIQSVGGLLLRRSRCVFAACLQSQTRQIPQRSL